VTGGSGDAAAVRTAVERYGGLDVYYVNAGIIGERKPFDDLSERFRKS